RTAPSVFSVPSKVVCSPIRLSTSTPSTTALRGTRALGRPTLTSLADERKLGPAAPGAAEPAAGAAPTMVSFGSGATGTVAASSRSLDDSAPRNRVHSCSSDFLNIWRLLHGWDEYADATRRQYRPLCKGVADGDCAPVS